MWGAGQLIGNPFSSHSCELAGRVLIVWCVRERLTLSVVVPGRLIEEQVVETRLETTWDTAGGCYCVTAWRGKILLVGRGQRDRLPAAVLIDPFTGMEDGSGTITEDSVSMRELKVREKGLWAYWSQMVTIADQVFLFKGGGDPIFQLEVDEEAGTLRASELGVTLGHGTCACPQVLADGRVMVIGVNHVTNRVSVLSLSPPSFESLPPLPYSAYFVGSTLLLDRFVAVFGGYDGKRCFDTLCIYDTLERRWSTVRKQGWWAQTGEYVALAVRDDYLYILGSDDWPDCYRISFSDLAGLIEDEQVLLSFSRAIGTPVRLLLARWMTYKWRAACPALGRDLSISKGMAVPLSQLLDPS